MNRGRRRLLKTALLTALVGIPAIDAAAANKTPGGVFKITSAQLAGVIQAHFDAKKGYKPTDLVHQGDVQDILAKLDRLGWRVADGQEILDKTLPTDHAMVKAFDSRQGTRFMRAVADYELIYDRMHRTAELPGGKALVRDIVKLPNGEIYAKMKPVPGNPTLTELLPKQRNGKTPLTRDFDKPTGYIYTAAQLAKRFEVSRKLAFRD